EEMIRNKDQYFFDSQAFEGIIDFYIEKNDPIKALQVVDYAVNQHPYAVPFLIKQAQLYILVSKIDLAFDSLHKAEMLDPSEVDIYLIRGGVLSTLERYDEAMGELNRAMDIAENPVEVHLQIAM